MGNPFAPRVPAPPPELAGRGDLRETVRIEAGADVGPEAGLAGNSDPEHDLAALLEVVGSHRDDQRQAPPQ